MKIHEDERKKAIKLYITGKLKKYEGTKVGNKDFRILQGVLSTRFGSQELGITEIKNRKERDKSILFKKTLKAVHDMKFNATTVNTQVKNEIGSIIGKFTKPFALKKPNNE